MKEENRQVEDIITGKNKVMQEEMLPLNPIETIVKLVGNKPPAMLIYPTKENEKEFD